MVFDMKDWLFGFFNINIDGVFNINEILALAILAVLFILIVVILSVIIKNAVREHRRKKNSVFSRRKSNYKRGGYRK